MLRGGERLAWLPGKEYDECFSVKNGEIHVESSTYLAEDGAERQNAKLLVGGTDYFMAENGVNLVVYEESMDQVIDAAGDDVYQGLKLIHKEKQEN